MRQASRRRAARDGRRRWLVAVAVALSAVLVGAGPAAAHQGVPDPSFGHGGTATFDPGFGLQPSATALSQIVQPDGRTVVVGVAYDSSGPAIGEVLVMRLRRNGTLDPSFGRGGIVKFRPLNSTQDYSAARAVALQPDGKIVVAGDWEVGTAGSFVMRLLPDGRLDRRFGCVMVARLTRLGRMDYRFGDRGVVYANFTPIPRFTGAGTWASGLAVDR